MSTTQQTTEPNEEEKQLLSNDPLRTNTNSGPDSNSNATLNPNAEGEPDDFSCGRSEFGQRMNYKDREYNDIWVALLWIASMVGMFIALVNVLYYRKFSSGSSSSSNKTRDVAYDISILVVCTLMAFVGGFIWLKAVQKWGAQAITAMLYGTLGVMGVMTVVYFLIGNLFFGIVCLIFTAVFAIYVYLVRRRIPLTAAMLRIASQIIEQKSSTVRLQLVLIFLQVLWVFWWIFVVLGLNPSNAVVYVALILCFYWTLQVLSNISHVTICGVTAVWFFAPNFRDPTWTAFKHAVTKSLGSICLGSLLVAIIQTARALVRSAQKSSRHQILLCLLNCLLGCLESLMRFFNTYAFAQVAIYGKAFITAARDARDLLVNKGLLAWINDDLTGFALACGAIITGLFAALVAFLMASAFWSGDSSNWKFALLGLAVGYVLCMLVLSVAASAVVALFVCWAEDPAAIQQTHPTEYNEISEHWRMASS